MSPPENERDDPPADDAETPAGEEEVQRPVAQPEPAPEPEERPEPIEATDVAEGAVIACDTLSRWFGPVIGVNNLTVSVEPGVTGLLGPNGAGKTTFMQLAMGLLKPSSGTISTLGEDPWNNTGLMRRIGYVGEGDAPWRELSGRECAMLAARLSGLDDEEASEAVERSLKEVGLGGVADRVVDGYSRGMRQRLKFALARLHDPELYILDEPLLGTDPETRVHLIQLIKDLAAEGRSVLVSTHVLPDVEAMTNRILLLNNGRLMAYGEVGEIRDMLEKYPRTVRIATPQPRELGSRLWGWESVLSVEAEDAALRVKTNDPKGFYESLHDLLETTEIPFTSVTSPDDTLEAVFRYLVE